MAQEWNDEVVVTREPGLLTAEIDGELVGMRVDAGACYGLDPIGARLWALIEQPRTIAGIVDALVTEYDVSRERCRADVVALLGDMAEERMVIVGG